MDKNLSGFDEHWDVAICNRKRSNLMKQVASPCPIFFIQESYTWRAAKYGYSLKSWNAHFCLAHSIPSSFYAQDQLCSQSRQFSFNICLTQGLEYTGPVCQREMKVPTGREISYCPPWIKQFISLGKTFPFQIRCKSKYTFLQRCMWDPGICKRGVLKVRKGKASSLQVFGRGANLQHIHMYVSPWKDTKDQAALQLWTLQARELPLSWLKGKNNISTSPSIRSAVVAGILSTKPLIQNSMSANS